MFSDIWTVTITKHCGFLLNVISFTFEMAGFVATDCWVGFSASLQMSANASLPANSVKRPSESTYRFSIVGRPGGCPRERTMMMMMMMKEAVIACCHSCFSGAVCHVLPASSHPSPTKEKIISTPSPPDTCTQRHQRYQQNREGRFMHVQDSWVRWWKELSLASFQGEGRGTRVTHNATYWKRVPKYHTVFPFYFIVACSVTHSMSAT